MLTATSVNLMESLGDRDVVHVCFCLYAVDAKSAKEQHEYRQRISAACKGGFHDVSSVPFSEAARQVNAVRSHIAVNLDGWTSAPHINEMFAMKPAPLSVGNVSAATPLTACSSTSRGLPEPWATVLSAAS